MVRKEIELLGFSFLKETDDQSFKNIIDEIHQMAGESVFGQKVYMTMQYKVQDKKYGRYDFSLSCNDKNSIMGTGIGKSKKKAEQYACKDTLINLGLN